MTEYDCDENPAYLREELEKYRDSNEFEGLAIVDLEVDERAIRKIVVPSGTVKAEVVGETRGFEQEG